MWHADIIAGSCVDDHRIDGALPAHYGQDARTVFLNMLVHELVSIESTEHQPIGWYNKRLIENEIQYS